MQIPITGTVAQTGWVIAALVAVIVLTLRRKPELTLTKGTTAELKGFAILAVLFAHIGYALVDDSRFLFPLSISAGVAVNAFLFLSGYGLVQASKDAQPSPLPFYRKRLFGLYLPFWLSLAAILLLDGLRLGWTRPIGEIISAFLGFFPKADLFQSLNSPLWYFTFIVAHYLLFPLVYRRTRPIFSALVFGLMSAGLTLLPWPIDPGVRSLYQLHVLAFPLGMLTAGLGSQASQRFTNIQTRWRLWRETHGKSFMAIRLLISFALLIPFVFFSLHAAIGEGVAREQAVSLLTMTCLLLFFVVKPFESRFLQLMGAYSYEIYLLHWPLLSRHDFLYGSVPASIATVAWITILIILGYGLQQITKHLNRTKKKEGVAIRGEKTA